MMLSVVLLIMLVNAVQCIDKCCIEVLNRPFFSLFNIHGRDLKNEIIRVKITPCNDTRICFMEEDMFLKSQDNKMQIRNLVIKLVCPSSPSLTVRLVPGSLMAMPDAITYLEIVDCLLLMDDFERLRTLFDIKVLNLLGHSDLLQNASSGECSSLSQVGSLSVLNKNIARVNISSLLSCDVENVVEVIIQNISMSSIGEIQTLMPHLQTLDLTYNNFSRPPFFPWNNYTMKLPKNISRNSNLQSHYTFYNTLDIPTNVYRREYKLSHNTKLNLTNFRFHGWIEKLSLTQCNLTELSSGLFSNVHHLHYLQLNGNKLQSLPSDIFYSLSNLRKLELQANNLSTFQDDTFRSLRELKSLNLANNSIVSLQGGIFRDLQKLDFLYLQNNDIRYINQSVFHGINTHLKELHLQNNPLSQFPEAILLLRGLQRTFLANSYIREIDFVKIESDVAWSELVASLADSLSTGTPNLDDVKGEPRVIDMSGSQVKSIAFSAKDYVSYWRLSLILKHFKIILVNNPITCDCNILNLTNAVAGLRANNTLTGREYMFERWTCAFPSELKGRRLFSVAPRETYCQVHIDQCPVECKCYRRSVVLSIIVDCRQLGLVAIPDHLPTGKLELWLQGNAIEDIDTGVHNKDVVSLLLSRNAVRQIRHDILVDMVSLRTLLLDDNLLASIPPEITTLELTSLKVGGNPLKCDCHALWMKDWILINDRIIQDSSNIKCVNSVSEEGIQVSLVPDEDFVCELTLQAVILPIAVPTIFILFLLTLGLTLFVMWQDFKVWLFVHTGLHPFDKKDILQNCHYDVFVLYVSSLADWVQGDITEPLESVHGLKLFDMHRDSRLGISFQANISHAVQSSKRIIFIVTKDSDDDVMARTALDAALAKCRNQKANFLVPVVHHCPLKKIANKSLQKYIKSKRYINTQEKTFLKRILYYLPQNRTSSYDKGVCAMIPTSWSTNGVGHHIGKVNINGSLGNSTNSSPVSLHSIQTTVSNHWLRPRTSVFVWYSDSDFRFTMEHVVLPYEQKGYNCILADRNFIPGAAIQENILSAVHNSFRTVIVLSEASARDEWLLFVFRFAYERQIKQKTYLVGLLVRKDLGSDGVDDEVAKQLESHVSVRECDRWFREKLITFLIPPDSSWMLAESVLEVQPDDDDDHHDTQIERTTTCRL